MTNQEYFEKLQLEYELAFKDYLRAEKEIFEEGDGFLDEKLLGDLIAAGEKLEFFRNSYNEFISFARESKIDPKAQFNSDM